MIKKVKMPRPNADKEGMNPIDAHVGAKLKSRRIMMGWSQEELGKSIGLTFQQVQKYERGTNRISVSRLADISHALKVPMEYFIDGCMNFLTPKKGALRGVSDNKQAVFETEPMTKKDVLELIRAYQNIKKPSLKKQLLEMAKAMGSDEE